MSQARALAFNAVAPAITRWNERHPSMKGVEPYWLPLSLRQDIADAILAELARAGLLADGTPPETPIERVRQARMFQDAPD